MGRVLSALTLAASAALLVGCEVGPDFQRPAAPQATGYTPEPLPASTASADTHGGEAQLLIAGRDIPGDWWALYRSPALNALIEDAIKANPNLDAARAA